MARIAARVFVPRHCSARRRGPAGAPRSYSVLHSRRRCAVKSKVIDHDIKCRLDPPAKPLNTYHHGDLRDALVQAALQEVELGGPEAINISALAKKLGVSQPAPYKHFADREALLTAVTAEAFRQFNAMLRDGDRKAVEAFETVALCAGSRWISACAATASIA